MIEKELLEKLTKIFGLKFNRFDSPGESQEQDTLFIEVDRVNSRVKDGRKVGRVEGKCIVFVQADKMPHGYFAERIAAHPDLCKDFFFSDIDENVKGLLNLTARTFSFLYFFNSQFDPAIGTITSVTTTIEVTP